MTAKPRRTKPRAIPQEFAGWSSEDRAEYEGMLAQIITATKSSRLRVDDFEKRLTILVGKGKAWAREVQRRCQRHGMASEIKKHQDRSRAMVSHDGRVVSLPNIQRRRVAGDQGQQVEERELIALWTWEQIAAKRAEVLSIRRTYNDKIAHYDKLLALKELAPGSTTPAEAAELLGIVLDDYLAKAE